MKGNRNMTPQYIRDAIQIELAKVRERLAESMEDDRIEAEDGEDFESRYTATEVLEDFAATLENLLQLAR
jgi:hypothetical protein